MLGCTIMTNGKLPISIQLIWGTAAVLFVTSALETYVYYRALSNAWDAFSNDTLTWSGFYYPIFFPVAVSVLLAIISLVSFVMLSLSKRAILVRVSVAYLTVLMVELAWRIYVHFPGGGIHGLMMGSRMSQIYFGLRVVFAIWLIALMVAVLPNNSFKATVKGRGDNPAPGAAP
jgi:hypothetical protein